MKKFFRPLALAALALFSFSNLNAQADDTDDSHTLTVDIPEVALLDIEGGAAITLEPAAPDEAGLPIDFTADTDNSLWLNYSSIIGNAPNDSRKVTVSVAGTLPTGSNLNVLAAADASAGAGNVGTAAGAAITLAATATDYDIITNIRSCYTGDGTSKGHQLTYSLTEDATNYGSLNFDTDYTVTVTYTLVDE